MTGVIEERIDNLIKYGLSEDLSRIPFSGAFYFSVMEGAKLSDYWITGDFDNRDEFFLLATTYFSFLHLVNEIQPKNKWREQFDVAYLLQTKANLQSVLSIDLLARSRCYADAFMVYRAVHSRLNLLLLFSLNPYLFNHWLRHPKDERYLDGHIRSELKNNGIATMQHLYELSSEIIHGQLQGLANAGVMKKGVFVEIPVVKNQIYVAAKFVFAAYCHAMVNMFTIDLNSTSLPPKLQAYIGLMEFLKNKTLLPNRYDHLWTLIAEDRHWEKIGKNKYKIGEVFDYDSYREQLWKFHRSRGQQKQLSKKYQISLYDKN